MNVNLVELLTHPAVILASIIGLDLLFGDPVYSCHPVRLIGNLISWFETKHRLIGLDGKFGGIVLVLLLLFCAFVVCTGISYFLTRIHWSLSWLWSVYLGWSFLALRDLLVHAKHVAEAMKTENLSEAKRQE